MNHGGRTYEDPVSVRGERGYCSPSEGGGPILSNTTYLEKGLHKKGDPVLTWILRGKSYVWGEEGSVQNIGARQIHRPKKKRNFVV